MYRIFRHEFLGLFLALNMIAPQIEGQEAKSLQFAFHDLVSQTNTGQQEDKALAVADLVAPSKPEDVSKTIPQIESSLVGTNDTTKTYAAYILTMISYRSDSENLLDKHVEKIAVLLDETNPHLQLMGVLVLGGMKPASPPTVVMPLVNFVQRTDRDVTAQVNALSALLRIRPADKRVDSTLGSFASRTLDSPAKEALANGIGNSRTESLMASDELIKLLGDGDEQVRYQAAQAFQRMPASVVMRAQSALTERIEHQDESQEVKDAAREAIRIAKN